MRYRTDFSKFYGIYFIESHSAYYIGSVLAVYTLVGVVNFIFNFRTKILINFAQLKISKSFAKRILFPTKLLIYCVLVLTIYSGPSSILCMIYNIGIVIIFMFILVQAKSENSSKINTNNFSIVVQLTTYLLLTLYTLINIMDDFQKSLNTRAGRNETPQFLLKVDEWITEYNLKRLLMLNKIMFKRPLPLVIFILWMISFYLSIKMVTWIAKNFETQMYIDLHERNMKRLILKPKVKGQKYSVDQDSHFYKTIVLKLDSVFCLNSSILINRKLKLAKSWIQKLSNSSP